MKMLRNLLVLLGLSLASAGCVDVDRESTADSSGPTETSRATGQAVKGILQGGRVSVYALENGQRRFLAESLTDVDGLFSLEVPQQSAPLLLELTPAGDGSSTMICDAASGCGAAGFGDPVALPPDFVLTALVTPDELERGMLTVTPMTHLVARWVASMPGGVSEQALKVARSQFSALLGLPPDFSFQKLPDITDAAAFEQATSGQQLHALFAAVMAEGSSQLGVSLNDFMEPFARQLVDNAGQLPRQGDASEQWLLAGAMLVSDAVGSPAADQWSADLQTRMAALTEGHTLASPGEGAAPEDMHRALTALNDLDHYLGLAGIDGDGDFFANQAHQVDWLYSEQMLSLLQKVMRSAVAAVTVSAVGDQLALVRNPVDLSGMFGTGVTALYDHPSQTLTVTGTNDGQTLDISLVITPFSALLDGNKLDYELVGSIANSEVSGSLQGSLDINTYETNFAPLIITANAMLTGGDEQDVQAFMDAAIDLMPVLHARATVNGAGELANVLTGERITGAVNAWAELDMPELGQGDFLVLHLDSGELVSPDGDRIFVNPAVHQPLHVTVGKEASLSAEFGFHAFGMPEMQVQAEGDVAGLPLLAESLSEALAGQELSGELALDQFLQAILELDPGLLSITGSAQLEVPADAIVYQFSLDGNVLTASLPNSTEPALTFHLAGLNGGYIYSGDSLVATVAFDWQRSGAMIHLANGESRSYLLGPLSDIIPRQLLDALAGLLGLEPSA